ncbi:G patch domain-containing protein 3 [Xyrauchen texanus]|uniref:G patch domain-containing protein 3 n=1 Tax=Xyrauchen texanus TaxID=154827 RepID=UPI002242A313|nr:G patch domain-containing protein 3 [Xyrauchen texanus]
MAAMDGATYLVINNIPVRLRSADLRNYFSQFIESKGFICFHYRHRPEVRVQTAAQGPDAAGTSERTDGSDGSKGKPAGSCCCVVSVRSNESDRFLKMYSGNQWIDSTGNWLARKCLIRRVKVSGQEDHNSFPYKTKAELRRHIGQSETFTMSDLKGLSELNPPSLMPAGNVGTPVTVFLELIQSCRLPPRLIRKLGLTFPKTGSHRRYGNVPYQYRSTAVIAPSEESVFTAGGVEISGPGSVAPPTTTQTVEEDQCHSPPPVNQESQEADLSGPDDDDDRCEEWERHEAFYDDVTSQERSKERLFEEKIELKWEKGGSGLVFYTDAQFWQEEEGDFDEQTADDWDVDMSVYYDKDGGDMDARDYVLMRSEKRLREGLEGLPGRQQKIGSFERFTKGVGRRVMEKQGWRDGKGLGNSQVGMSDALESEGQHPHCKRGFGYHGEKLSSFLPLKKPRKEFHISTIYDKPKDIDKGDELLRRQPNTSIKYRDWHPAGSAYSTSRPLPP